MQRPDTPDGLFLDGNPNTGVKGTPITAAWLNALIAVGAFLSGDTEPPAAELGGPGDYYVCKTTPFNLYGPKDPDTGWPGVTTRLRGDTISIGEVVTGAPGSQVTIENVGTARDIVLDISIPKGDMGLTGNPYKAYATLTAANADLANIPADALVWINADGTAANIGFWSKTGGVLVQSSYDRVALLEVDENNLWQKHTNIALPMSSGGKITISSVAANTVTLSMSSGFYVNGKDDFKNVPALASIALGNTQALYLDITNLAAITWSTATAITNVKDSKNKILVFINFYGKLVSPIPSVQRLIKDAEDTFNTADASSLFKKQVNLVVVQTAGLAPAVISSISGTDVTFTFPVSWFLDFDSTFKAIPALASTTLANTQCLYLDTANLDAITWSGPNYTPTQKSTKTRVVVIVNFYGRLWSPIAGIQSMLDKAEVAYRSPAIVAAELLVAPAGGDYTTITDAISAIVDASISKPYRVHVAPGFYDELGPNGNGLELKPYVHLVGAGRGVVAVKGPEAAAGQESTKSCIHKVATCTISGMTLVAYKNKYPVHADSATYLDLDFTARDCDLQHYGGSDGYLYDIGIGIYQNQKITLDNCNLLGEGLYCHGPAGSRAVNTSWKLQLDGVCAKTVYLQDFLEYTTNKVVISGSRIEVLKFAAVRTYYDANPADTLFNRGYFNTSMDLQARGSSVGRIEYIDSFTLDTVLIKHLIIPGMNVRAVNKGAGGVTQGQALKLLANPAMPNAYPSATLQTGNVAAWDGSGVFAGFAEADMAVGDVKTYQYSGMPKALADATIPIEYGDELEIDSTGNVVKKTTGITRAYAQEAKASGTGLIVVKLI
ncbi:MAG: hypothetical protein V1791_10775 [Pseudomonadota bacterium]